MNKIIVTTTINEPTEATLKFASMHDWHVVIAGDTKTPHDKYENLQNVTYLHPEDQENINKELSDAIGWRSIRRRNMAIIKAYQMGADIIATVDDDNIPLEKWGDNLFVGEEVEVDFYDTTLDVFDPIYVTEHKNIWHRGFPLQYVSKRNAKLVGKRKINCLVQADFWNGDPDIDAVCRITQMPELEFKPFKPFASKKIAPFNSQNTFLHREIIPYYMVIPHVGRMDDIWGAYALQQDMRDVYEDFVLYNQATVYQDRNDHDLTLDMEQEMIGYKLNPHLITNGYESVLPEKASKAFSIYKNSF
tara:strand:- start:13690 stop:14601 length:912 start_codon:yes stop_codon:yes gene_type:complete